MRYYQLQRQSDEHASARTTVRLLESLLRLSEAHAKLMFRDKVWKEDAVVAIHCVSLSNPMGTSLLGEHYLCSSVLCDGIAVLHRFI